MATEGRTAMMTVQATQGARGAVTILHISDLHVGWGFSTDLWDGLCNLAANEIKPDLVIATGDFVHSPFRWRLATARKKLQSLKDRLAKVNPNCQFIAVPGNHDTRIQGLVPIWWVLYASGVLAALAVAVAHGYWLVELRWASVVAFVSLIGLWAALWVCFGNINTSFKDFVLSGPTPYDELGLAIFPFDSASSPLYLAGGKVKRPQFGKAKNEQPQGSLYRIAILHHHVLPIPYDSKREDAMILHNAGTFLQEMSELKIRLILHGHKHHAHFSRATINAGVRVPFEVGVLAAGTPSAGKRPGRFGYHFNVLRLDSGGNLQVTPYEASEGAFKEKEPFLVEDSALRARRVYESNVREAGRRYASVVSRRKITPDGDLYHRMEYRGFRIETEKGSLSLLGPVTIETTTGHIERFDGGPLGSRGLPGTQLEVQRTDTKTYNLQYQKGQIRFGRTLEPGNDPVDFFFHHYGINADAMSAQQYREMYESYTDPPVEFAEVTLTDTPAEELWMLIQFPDGFTIDGYPQLVIKDAPAGSFLQPRDELQEALVYDTVTNMIVLRIPHPVLHVCYRIEWRLADHAPPAGDRVSSLVGQAREIATLLQQQPLPTPDRHPLQAMLPILEADARVWFKLENATEDPLDISIMVYDERARLLKTCVGNFPREDARWQSTFKYGNGIAGRAHKMNTARVFVKEYAVRTRTPYYYYPPAGKPIVHPREIEEEAVVAIPLNHPQHPDYVYAILNVSSRRPGSKLVEVRQQDVESATFREAVNKTCFAALKGIGSLLKQRP